MMASTRHRLKTMMWLTKLWGLTRQKVTHQHLLFDASHTCRMPPEATTVRLIQPECSHQPHPAFWVALSPLQSATS
ncbi:MAG: hypothetical protein RIT44_571 [Pseudomonadota bacterium]